MQPPAGPRRRIHGFRDCLVGAQAPSRGFGQIEAPPGFITTDARKGKQISRLPRHITPSVSWVAQFELNPSIDVSEFDIPNKKVKTASADVKRVRDCSWETPVPKHIIIAGNWRRTSPGATYPLIPISISSSSQDGAPASCEPRSSSF